MEEWQVLIRVAHASSRVGCGAPAGSFRSSLHDGNRLLASGPARTHGVRSYRCPLGTASRRGRRQEHAGRVRYPGSSLSCCWRSSGLPHPRAAPICQSSTRASSPGQRPRERPTRLEWLSRIVSRTLLESAIHLLPQREPYRARLREPPSHPGGRSFATPH